MFSEYYILAKHLSTIYSNFLLYVFCKVNLNLPLADILFLSVMSEFTWKHITNMLRKYLWRHIMRWIEKRGRWFHVLIHCYYKCNVKVYNVYALALFLMIYFFHIFQSFRFSYLCWKNSLFNMRSTPFQGYVQLNF